MPEEEKKEEETKKEILYVPISELQADLDLITGKEYNIIIRPERIYLAY